MHYDSDKTVHGRREALRLLAPSLRPGALIVMDDIQDNVFFAELVASRRSHVFRFERKFLGLVEWT